MLEPLKPARSGRNVYVYFDNDVKVRAPADARALADRLGVAVAATEPMPGKDKPRPHRRIIEEARRHWPAP